MYEVWVSHTIYQVILKVDEVENQPKKIVCGRVMQITTDPVCWLIRAHTRSALIQGRAQALITASKSKFQFLSHHVKLLRERVPLIGWLVLTIYFLFERLYQNNMIFVSWMGGIKECTFKSFIYLQWTYGHCFFLWPYRMLACFQLK